MTEGQKSAAADHSAQLLHLINGFGGEVIADENLKSPHGWATSRWDN